MRAWGIILAVAFASPAHAEALRIMPLGDSITAGIGAPGGYRTPLFHLLGDCDFVGSLSDNPGDIPDNDHEGRGGAQIPLIRHLMVPALAVSQPDVILLLAGTNDVTYSMFNPDLLTATGIVGRFEELLLDIYAHSPASHVVLGSILRAASDDRHITLSGEVNSLLPDLIAARVAVGQHVTFVDTRNAVTLPEDFADSLHPSALGYDKLAHVWHSAIATGAMREPRLAPGLAGDEIPPESVPEPSAIVLFLLGSHWLIARVRWLAASRRRPQQ